MTRRTSNAKKLLSMLIIGGDYAAIA